MIGSLTSPCLPYHLYLVWTTLSPPKTTDLVAFILWQSPTSLQKVVTELSPNNAPEVLRPAGLLGGFGGLVTIKVMRAELSSIEEVTELSVPRSI